MRAPECARFLGRILTDIDVPKGGLCVDVLPRQENGGFPTHCLAYR
jgi:hypothetical protein